MRKLLLVGALGFIGLVLRKILRRPSDPADVALSQPQRSVQAMEQAADIPGGVRP